MRKIPSFELFLLALAVFNISAAYWDRDPFPGVLGGFVLCIAIEELGRWRQKRADLRDKERERMVTLLANRAAMLKRI